MSDLTQALLAVHEGTNEARQEAEAYLNSLRVSNYGGYMLGLCHELVGGPTEVSRQLAGLALKVLLDARDPITKMKLAQAWRELDEETRMTIKNGLFQTLGSDATAAMTAAAVVAKIAAIELPEQMWPGLVEALLQNMTVMDNDMLRQSTLACLGYICEGVKREVLAAQSGQILTAVMSGVEETERNDNVRLEATKALYNALEFVSDAFEVPDDRDYIMTVVCSATQASDTRIRRAALECLVRIASFFYGNIQPYMEALYQLTFEAIRSDPEQSALQAIEFWSTICEEEIFLHLEAEDAQQRGQHPKSVSLEYVATVLGPLVELLTQTMCRQEEDQQPTTWNISMAAGTCLNLVAKDVRDAVLEYVVPFIVGNVEGESWRHVEAAIFAFGSILEGVSSAAVGELIAMGLPTFATLMGSDVLLIAESAAWTIGAVCKYHAEAIPSEHGPALLEAINDGLGASPRVAVSCCWALHNLAKVFAQPDADTYGLSPFFADLAVTLLSVTVRGDGDMSNLRGTAYTTLNVMIESSAKDCLVHVSSVFATLLERLGETLAYEISSADEMTQRSDLQGLICSSLQAIIERVEGDIMGHADSLMEAFLAVLRCRTDTVHEEAMVAIGALARAIDEDFEPYMNAFFEFLMAGIKSHQEPDVCIVSIGVLGDCCRALEKSMAPYADDIIGALIANLNHGALPDRVKPVILAAFGDLALAIEAAFAPHVNPVMQLLCQASQVFVDTSYPELVVYLNSLRENVFEGFTGIIQGLREAKKEALLDGYVEHLFAFIGHVYKDEFRSEEVTRAAVGCLGDLAHTYGTDVGGYLKQEWVLPLIRELDGSDDEDTIEVATFARQTVRRYRK
ncbi:binding/protein transporter [Thecamonas trahens ATCC 50062]|uniref:Binding/protein transporter n=1 Tax=Thecamonas trahens ATCC 50062 TaxID=461836 RepID=A0A0L0D992_THETB|nr:binding/protein transporter [Thecamonas trahens ATCC 50062]KNC48611.1 binding/protein transporter [Thecamonas trahens ATCC 50062]|eukprot:XP_013762667.1 binding/protein transporter [Thecamonas trahens ATCC 50062]